MFDRIRAAWHRLSSPLTTGRSIAWDAAGAGSRLQQWAPPSTAFATNLTAPMLKERARDLYRNSSWARRLLDALVIGAVGAGIKPQLRADGDLKRRVQQEWLLWTDAADFAGRYDFYGLQQAALRTMLIDGECFLRLVLDPEQHIPLQLQLLASEFLDATRADDRTLNGIEYDAAGRRVAYWLYRRHPAEAPDMQSVRVPAEQVIHLYVPIQPGVERGVTWLAPAMVPLRELQEFTEAALVRQKIASLFCGYVQTADGSSLLNQTNLLPVLEPGTMTRLQPGEAVEFTEPPDVGQTYEPFVRQQLRAIASALNVPYEILSGDVSAVTYASGRHALLEYQRHLESLQHHVLVFQLCRPVWVSWTRAAVAAGVLPEGDYSEVRWIAPRLQMLDSRMEVQSIIQQIRGGLLSRSEAVSAMGWDIEQIDLEIAADAARADALGLTFDSDPRKTTQQGQQTAEQEARV